MDLVRYVAAYEGRFTEANVRPYHVKSAEHNNRVYHRLASQLGSRQYVERKPLRYVEWNPLHPGHICVMFSWVDHGWLGLFRIGCGTARCVGGTAKWSMTSIVIYIFHNLLYILSSFACAAKSGLSYVWERNKVKAVEWAAYVCTYNMSSNTRSPRGSSVITSYPGFVSCGRSACVNVCDFADRTM
jgi:hypothetical protein